MNHLFQKAQSVASQLSYRYVRTTFIFLIIGSALLYVALVVSSTATIAHSKTMVRDIRDRQGEIAELNVRLALKNQDLALKLQDENEFIEPDHVWYVRASAVDQPAFALDH